MDFHNAGGRNKLNWTGGSGCLKWVVHESHAWPMGPWLQTHMARPGRRQWNHWPICISEKLVRHWFKSLYTEWSIVYLTTPVRTHWEIRPLGARVRGHRCDPRNPCIFCNSRHFNTNRPQPSPGSCPGVSHHPPQGSNVLIWWLTSDACTQNNMTPSSHCLTGPDALERKTDSKMVEQDFLARSDFFFFCNYDSNNNNTEKRIDRGCPKFHATPSL